MVEPASLTVDDVRTLIAENIGEDARAALAYLRGDLWQGGAGWRGPRPPVSHPDYASLVDEIRRVLAGPNFVRAVVGRHVAGVLGREPQWELSVFAAPEPEQPEPATPTTAAPPAEGDAPAAPPPPNPDSEALTAWWDRTVLVAPSDDRERAPIAGGVLGIALARGLCGDRPVLRLRVTGDRRAPAPADLGAALARIAVEVLPSGTAAVISDLDEGPLAAAVLARDMHSLAGRLKRETADELPEVVYVGPDGRTVISVGGELSDPLPLGGRLTMAALHVPMLITPGLLGIQRQAVKTMTVMGRNTDTAGFAETTYLNADRPTREIDDPAAPGGKREVPAPIQTGPAVRNFFYGAKQPDGSLATPEVHERAPVPPGTFLDTLAGLRASAHEEAHQLHALIAGDATPSGESRRQAAADFLSSLGPSKQGVEGLARWLLETAYALAVALMGGTAPDDLRATVTCHLSGTLPTVEELKEAREGVGAKLLSRATYQTAAGVADTEAEDEAIHAEREANPPPPQLIVQPTTTTTPVDAQPAAAGAETAQEAR
jgi:hypothetical protein